jgi:hypothetical protein
MQNIIYNRIANTFVDAVLITQSISRSLSTQSCFIHWRIIPLLFHLFSAQHSLIIIAFCCQFLL